MRTLVRFAALLLHCIVAFFRSHREQAIVNLALQQQLAAYAQKRPRPKLSPRWTELSGLRSRDSGHVGRIISWSFARRPWCDGTAMGSASTGDRELRC